MTQRCKECQFEEGRHSFECSKYEDQINYPPDLEDDLESPLDPDELFEDEDFDDEEDLDEEEPEEEGGAGRGVRPRR